MGALTFRIGRLGGVPIPKPIPKAKLHRRAPNPTCSTGGFYTAPTQGQVVDSSQPVNITWDPTCLETSTADIYLYSQSSTPPVIHMFQGVDFAKGSYQADLFPRWWGSTQKADLQLVIIEHDMSPSMATLPAGPIWTATYTPPPTGQPIPASADTSVVDNGITPVDNALATSSGGVSKGGIAAAVLIPLIVIGLGIAAYVKLSRARQESRRKRFSEAIDKRMSVISVDWRSMTSKGADAAIQAITGERLSMAGRSSTGNRASSTFATEGAGDDCGEGGQQMTQIRRPGVGPRGAIPSTASGERVSRVSFAADTRFSRASIATRPSGESRRAGIPSRAFHSSYIPPVPPVNIQNDSSDSDPERAMSPTQRDGPLSLSAEDIRARVRGLQANSNSDPEPRPSIDEVIPALSMMRMRNDSQADLLIGQASPDATKLHHDITPTLPPPVATAAAPSTGHHHQQSTNMEIPISPIAGSMPMSMHSPDAMSPDDMLRVYAERRKTGGSSVMMSPLSPGLMSPPSPSIAFPMPVATAPAGSNNPFRQSMAVNGRCRSDEYDNDEAYLGTAA